LFRAIAPRCQATSRRLGITNRTDALDDRHAIRGDHGSAAERPATLITPPDHRAHGNPARPSTTQFCPMRSLSTTHPKKYSHERSSDQVLGPEVIGACLQIQPPLHPPTGHGNAINADNAASGTEKRDRRHVRTAPARGSSNVTVVPLRGVLKSVALPPLCRAKP
jgi:hypothetical protein